MKKSRSNTYRHRKRFAAMVRHPYFWVLTLTGNGIVLVGSLFLHLFESNLQGKPVHYIDSLLWSAGTVTTVGYGSYTPETIQGKITLLVLMLTGPLFIWLYMAFWVTGLLAPELALLEKDVHEVEREIRNLKVESSSNEMQD